MLLLLGLNFVYFPSKYFLNIIFKGWEIGVLEAVILVVVVGLSFDYTLHFGATIPLKGVHVFF